MLLYVTLSSYMDTDGTQKDVNIWDINVYFYQPNLSEIYIIWRYLVVVLNPRITVNFYLFTAAGHFGE